MHKPALAALALLALEVHCSREAPPPLLGGFENRRVLEAWMAAYGAAPEPGRLPALLVLRQAHAVGGHCKSDPTRALFAASVFDAEPRTVATTRPCCCPACPTQSPNSIWPRTAPASRSRSARMRSARNISPRCRLPDG